VTPDENRRVLSVTQLNELGRRVLEGAFPSVWVEGEVSNFQAAASGHWYFTLKDGTAQVRCAMFRGRNIRARLRPANGDSLLVRGAVSLYAPRGEYQLIAEELEAAGLGALQRALEALRRRLAAEGLFDAARKRALPAFPAHLGIVTSPRGAVLHDVLTVLRRRFPALPVTLFPVPVQGEGAALQIAQAVATANRVAAALDPPLDVLLVARGGGSLEDLWAFNEEPVLRAIHASALPVVSAVGHETDVTLADLVADVRAPTPSAAAELISPDREQLVRRLAAHAGRLAQLQSRRIARERERLGWLVRRLRHPGVRLREQSQRLDELEQRLRAALRRRLALAATRLGAARAGLDARAPRALIDARRERLSQLRLRLGAAARHALSVRGERLAHGARLLESVSPLATLARGYAIVSDPAGRVLRDATQVAPGTRVRARLTRGSLECTVDATRAD
jgi:exodeoxyribonuclease VII large subunit